MTSFGDLNEIDRAVLDTASEEGLPWEACAEWSRDPRTRSVADIEVTRRAAEDLVRRGLIWMYRIADDSPDLADDEVHRLLADTRTWEYHPDGTNGIALYLTPTGEQLFYGESRGGA